MNEQPTSVVIDGERWVPISELHELQVRHERLLTAAATAYAAKPRERPDALEVLALVIKAG